MQTSSRARPAPLLGSRKYHQGAASSGQGCFGKIQDSSFQGKRQKKKDNTYILLYIHGKMSDKYRIDVTEMVFICQAKS